MKQYKYLDIITVIFVVILLLSNFIAVNKVSQISGFIFGSGVIFFPISYLAGDILTEVYGYSKSRRVIWIGFGAMIFSAIAVQIILHLPPSPEWLGQRAFETVLGNTPRIVFSSILAFWAGEFANSYTLAKMKITTNGKYLWTRTIGSTIIGEGVDTLIFYPLALSGLPGFPWHLIFSVMLGNYIIKVLWEVIATPVTYKVVSFLKQKENEDYYDYKTNFSPFYLSQT